MKDKRRFTQRVLQEDAKEKEQDLVTREGRRSSDQIRKKAELQIHQNRYIL